MFSTWSKSSVFNRFSITTSVVFLRYQLYWAMMLPTEFQCRSPFMLLISISLKGSILGTAWRGKTRPASCLHCVCVCALMTVTTAPMCSSVFAMICWMNGMKAGDVTGGRTSYNGGTCEIPQSETSQLMFFFLLLWYHQFTMTGALCVSQCCWFLEPSTIVVMDTFTCTWRGSWS